ncbi:MAG: reverse transcriptase domain-containing protein [Chitinophagales bacterium]
MSDNTTSTPVSLGRNRQEIYEEIKKTSKDAFILKEMKRLGFWEEDEDKPSVPGEIIQKEVELNQELQKLVKQQRKRENTQKLLKEIRQKRMADAKQRRIDTKKKREEDRKAKSAAWAKKQETDIVYLGEEVSYGLHNKESDTKLLAERGLPIFENIEDLAAKMETTVSNLRFLAFTRKTSKISHYKRFTLPKKSGGQRMISAPMPRLKAAQYWLLENLLYKVPLHEAAHGFNPEHSIMTNAKPHVGKDMVINMDLKDFFPTLSYKRVKGMFRKMGYSEQIATVFGLICTEPEVDEVQLDGEKYFVAKGNRFLPQGAPTSPAITNIICRRMDARMEGIAQKLNYSYTRYADDMTFSCNGTDQENVGKLLWQAKQVIKDEGFNLHPDKLRIMRNGRRKEVTGIVVNEKLNIERATLRKFRATLHHIETKGLEGAKWGKGNILNAVQSYANFIAQVDAEKGAKYVAQVERIQAKYGGKKTRVNRITNPNSSPTTNPNDNASSTNEDETDKPWWKMW